MTTTVVDMSTVHYLPVPVAHDHGYGYLQTKDVSGAVFEGASDGVFVRSNESGFWLAIGLTSKKQGGNTLGTKKKAKKNASHFF